MSEKITLYELELSPIYPDKVGELTSLQSRIEEKVKEAGYASLLPTELKIESEKTFPTNEVIIIGFTLLSSIALETYKDVILPYLKNEFEIKVRAHKMRDK